MSSQEKWPGLSPEMREDAAANEFSGVVGSVLVSETDEVRVWHLHLKPGYRCPFHRHVLNYFWTCHSHGSARNYFEDGTTKEVRHFPGDTRHLYFGKGESMLHSVMNTGDTDLLFTTVEFKAGSPNAPLPVPDSVRLKIPA